MAAAPVKLLWTGGWDSSFQLLRLLLEHRCQVVPYYLRDAGRRSVAAELAAMEALRAALARTHPHTRTLLAETRIIPVEEVADDAEVREAFQRLACAYPIGRQYAWLAAYCRQAGLHDLEVGAERVRQGAGTLMMDRVELAQAPAGYPAYRLAPAWRGSDVDVLFGRYLFPIMGWTKREMAAIATARGWSALMALTWFCHRPAGGNRPCGLCNPCLGAVEQGLGWRVPAQRRIAGHLYRRTLRPVRRGLQSLILRWRGVGWSN